MAPRATSKPTAASAWGEKPELVQLPSGKRARLRRKVNAYAALRAGVLTLQHVEDWEASQRGELQDAARAMALQDALIAWLFIEPQCVTNGSKPDGAISVADLDDEDLDFLIARALGGTPDEGAFREGDGVPGDAGGAGAGADGEDVGAEPKPAARAQAGNGGGVSNRPPPGRKAARPRKRAPRAK